MPTNDRHLFPWIVVRPASWRTYYLCSEIRWHLNEISKNGAKIVAYWTVVAVPFFASDGIMIALGFIVECISNAEPYDNRSKTIDDSRSTLSLNEVRRRLGKPPVLKSYGGPDANTR